MHALGPDPRVLTVSWEGVTGWSGLTFARIRNTLPAHNPFVFLIAYLLLLSPMTVRGSEPKRL